MRGSYGGMPPGMLSWARQVDKSIEGLQKDLKDMRESFRNAPTYKRQWAGDSTVLTQAAGAAGLGWQKRPSGEGPTATIKTTTGLLIITMSCAFDLVDASTTTPRQCVASLCATVDETMDGATSAELQANARQGLTKHWSMAAGQNSDRVHAASRTVYRNVEPGMRTVSLEYLFNQVTAGIGITWQDRQLIVETI